VALEKKIYSREPGKKQDKNAGANWGRKKQKREGAKPETGKATGN